MPTALYTKAVEGFMKGRFRLTLDVINAVLVDGGLYEPQIGTDQYLDRIPEAAEVAGPVALTGKTLVDGVFNADDTPFLSVPGTTAEYVVLYKQGDTRGQSELIAIFDAHPVVDAGGDDVTIMWPPDGILTA